MNAGDNERRATARDLRLCRGSLAMCYGSWTRHRTLISTTPSDTKIVKLVCQLGVGKAIAKFVEVGNRVAQIHRILFDARRL